VNVIIWAEKFTPESWIIELNLVFGRELVLSFENASDRLLDSIMVQLLLMLVLQSFFHDA
jgi:hypothetical protein